MKVIILTMLLALLGCEKLYNIIPDASEKFKLKNEDLQHHGVILKEIGLSDCMRTYIKHNKETFEYKIGYICKQKYRIGFKSTQIELDLNGKILSHIVVSPL